jgi:phage gpG-like protein
VTDGIALHFSLDDAALERELAALAARGGDLKPALRDIGLDMVAITIRAFETSESPQGEPWPPSKAAQDEGRRTLIDTTNLFGSFSGNPEGAIVVGDMSVVYGTNVPYAAYLQTGYSFVHRALAGIAFAGTGLGEELDAAVITVPPRVFVDAADRDIRRWEATLRDYLAGPSSGGAA